MKLHVRLFFRQGESSNIWFSAFSSFSTFIEHCNSRSDRPQKLNRKILSKFLEKLTFEKCTKHIGTSLIFWTVFFQISSVAFFLIKYWNLQWTLGPRFELFITNLTYRRTRVWKSGLPLSSHISIIFLKSTHTYFILKNIIW